jgi:hypothetical protein
MGNLLFLFIPTLKVLREFLEKDMIHFPLYRYLIRMGSIYRKNRSITFPELFCLSDTIRKYLGYLSSKGLQEYMLDIYKADLTKAYMQVKFNNWQYHRAGEGLPVKPDKISDHHDIKILPYWDIISVKYNILQFVNNPLSDFQEQELQKGKFHYVVLPVSENQTRLFELSDKHLSLIKNLSDMSVPRFLKQCQSIIDRNEAKQLLRKLTNLGMIEIKTSG